MKENMSECFFSEHSVDE